MTQATLDRSEVKDSKTVVRKARHPWRAVAEFLLFLIAGLLLLEPTLKIAGVGDEDKYAFDRDSGWTSVPNRSATCRTEGYSRYKINSLGMRDFERTFAKPAHTFRIAVLGCSMMEGKQVPLEQTTCSALERQLNASGGSTKYEVLNFAVSAYTLGQEYLRLKYFALRFKPDLVIFTARPNSLLYMGPELKNDFFHSRPVFGVGADGTLLEDRNYQKHWLASPEGRRMESTQWLRNNSCLFGVWGRCVCQLNEYKTWLTDRLSRPFRSAKQRAEIAAANAAPREYMPAALEYLGKVAAAIVREAKAECDREHCRFVLVYLPTTSKDRISREEEIFRNFAQQQHVDFIDFNPEFDRIERASDEKLYLRVHLSKFGHETTATYLRKWLEKNGILKSGHTSETGNAVDLN